MRPSKNNLGDTEIFRVSSSDATVPDLVSGHAPAFPTLTIVKGSPTDKTFVLKGTEVILGRDPKSDVCLDDMTVSRKHARIDLTNVARGVASIEDLGSLNGTWVDGAIINKALIKDGSTIQIGTFRMVFHTNRRPMRVETGA